MSRNFGDKGLVSNGFTKGIRKGNYFIFGESKMKGLSMKWIMKHGGF